MPIPLTDEPTEAPLCRMMLARMEQSNAGFTPHTSADRAALRRMVTEAAALHACMKAAGWLDEAEEPPHLWSAG